MMAELIILKRETRYSKIKEEDSKIFFGDLHDNLEKRLVFKDWHILKEPEGICFYKLNSSRIKHLELIFKIRIIINNALTLKVLIAQHEISRLSTTLRSWHQLQLILNELDYETPQNIHLNDLKEEIEESNFQDFNEGIQNIVAENKADNSFELCLVEQISNHDMRTEEDTIIEEYIEERQKNSCNQTLEIEVISKIPNEEIDETQSSPIKTPKPGKTGKLEIFCCKQCHRKFVTSLKLKFHIKHHHKPVVIKTTEEIPPDPQISCKKCEKLFITSKLLKRHQQRDHSLEEPLNCTFCQKEFHFLYKFREHKARCNPVNNFVCQICGKTFNMKKKLDSHVIRHQPNKKQQCPHCEKLFFPGSDLNKHVKRHLNLRKHVCGLCSKSFTQAVALKNHQETHNRIKSKCVQCSKEFSTTLSMKRHLRMYCGKGEPAEIIAVLPEVGAAIHHKYSYNCFIDDCVRKFALKKLLKKHLESSHNVVIPNFERYCLECKQEFESDNIYYSHVKTHLCVHTCKLCGKGFRTREIVERHELTHAEDEIRSFGCDKCGLKFKTDSNLRSHKLMKHSTERQFACKFCEQRFVFSRQLDNHIKVVHSRESKYECLSCKESFKWLRTFKMHMKKKHDLKDVYGCDKCEASFGHLNELKLHKHEQHGETLHRRKDIQQEEMKDVVEMMH